jgi:hypothetical protein
VKKKKSKGGGGGGDEPTGVEDPSPDKKSSKKKKGPKEGGDDGDAPGDEAPVTPKKKSKSSGKTEGNVEEPDNDTTKKKKKGRKNEHETQGGEEEPEPEQPQKHSSKKKKSKDPSPPADDDDNGGGNGKEDPPKKPKPRDKDPTQNGETDGGDGHSKKKKKERTGSIPPPDDTPPSKPKGMQNPIDVVLAAASPPPKPPMAETVSPVPALPLVEARDTFVAVAGRSVEGQLGIDSASAIQETFVISRAHFHAKPVQVFTGGYHSFVLLQDHTLLGFGDNTQGQTGAEAVSMALVPTPVPLPFGCEIDGVYCGETHTIVRTNIGLYAFGAGSEGQLGLGEYVTVAYQPSRISMQYPVRLVACGSHHSVVACKNNQVYSFGYNECGQLMQGDTVNRMTPTPVPKVDASTIISMACGVTHTILHCRDGILAAGDSRFGQLGIGDRAHGQCVVVPAHVHFFDCMLEDIRGVSAWFHTVLWTQSNVFVCGEGAKGKLGLGSHRTENVGIPAQVPFFADGARRIVKAVAAAEHTMFLTSDGVFACGTPQHGIETLSHGCDHSTPILLSLPSLSLTRPPVAPTVLDLDTKIAHTLIIART